LLLAEVAVAAWRGLPLLPGGPRLREVAPFESADGRSIARPLPVWPRAISTAPGS